MYLGNKDISIIWVTCNNIWSTQGSRIAQITNIVNLNNHKWMKNNYLDISQVNMIIYYTDIERFLRVNCRFLIIFNIILLLCSYFAPKWKYIARNFFVSSSLVKPSSIDGSIWVKKYIIRAKNKHQNEEYSELQNCPNNQFWWFE